MQTIFLNDILLFDWTIAEFIFYLFNVFALFTIGSSSVLSYLYIRPKLPARVNCWFCNRSFWVSYQARNCFDCRFCDQYNGFSDDGDYNTNILSRNKEKVSEPKFTQSDAVNGLCASCNLNQQLKVQQLSSFIPMNNDNYEEEVDHYRDQLEKSYKLCDGCSLVLTQTLQAQHYKLLAKRLNSHCPSGSNQQLKNSPFRFQVRRRLFMGSTVCLALLILVTVYELFFEMSHLTKSWKVELFRWLGPRQISTFGAVFALLAAIADEKITTRNYLYFSSWGIVSCLSWTVVDPPFVFLASIVSLIIRLWPETIELKKVPDSKVETPVATDKTAHSVNEAIRETVKKSLETQAIPQVSKAAKTVEKPKKAKPSMEKASPISEPKNSRSRLASPTPEMYSSFNRMRLSSPCPERRPTQNTVTPKTNGFIKPAKLIVKDKQKSPIKNYLAPNELDLNLYPYSYTPYHVACDYSSGFLTPVSHAAHTTYSISGPGAYPFGFPNARFSPPMPSPYLLNHSPTVSSSPPIDDFRPKRSGPVLDWMKLSFAVGSVALNLILVTFFIYQLFVR